ncbi:hypothetical protein JIN84_18010 [Luteolibacter yonseiensis]|uniref:Uncharacterized protein n=1 Tax=Luteolibacter yonseiensis TaxID=1144680 RepID=A0A934VD03_9BACT|nr:hypothetical protein [Luteolibacter yonseiensis]MBK1817521.1 hypothetical protein [Luteolibacter yonseiensis]
MTPATIDPPETTDPLILTGEGYGLIIGTAAETAKATLLKNSKLIVEVTDPVGDAAADTQLKALAAMRIGLEKTRASVKKPALDFGLKVDQIAKSFIAEVIAEEGRLKKARGSYAEKVLQERNRVIRELEERRQEEGRQLREEQEAAQKLEDGRIAAEQALWEADSPEEEAAAAVAMEKVKAETSELTATVRPPVNTSVVTFAPPVPRGVKMVPEYEVTDIDALYRHNAGLVTLTPRRMEILEAIARGRIGDDLPQIPGLKIKLVPQVR